MRDLLDFLVRSSNWILFAIYVVVSCILLFSSNPFQHHVYLTSAGAVASTVYRASNTVTGYFALREINSDLQHRNADLEMQVLNLQKQLCDERLRLYADTMTVDTVLSRYTFIIANVINNSISRSHNYITLEKGSADGLKPEMGVVDQNGVVGIVNVTGPHTARVISLLNPYLRIACKVKSSKHVGSLHWDGKSPQTAILDELPRHVELHPGDTIVTSGYSTAFPEGVPVGTVLSAHKDNDDNFYSLKVKLFTDFSTLSTVRVIVDAMTEELRTVEQDITETQKKIN